MLALRPRLVRWGASDEEVTRAYPGRELIPDGTRASTMAATIAAPPEQVWPWLVQMGWDRAGWYSWDRLDNGGRPSVREVHPEWQSLSVGDHLMGLVARWPNSWPKKRLGGSSARTRTILRAARGNESAWPHPGPVPTPTANLR